MGPFGTGGGGGGLVGMGPLDPLLFAGGASGAGFAWSCAGSAAGLGFSLTGASAFLAGASPLA